MDWNGFVGLIYGFLSGLFEVLPASSQAHQVLLLKLLGLDSPGYGMSFAVHFGVLAAVVVSYYGKIGKLAMEQRLAAQPSRQRKRQPDAVSLIELRLIKTATLPLILSCLVAGFLSRFFSRLWVIVILVVLNGVLVLLPLHMPRANKDARSVSPLDALLVGLGGIFGIVPGFSRVGILTSLGQMRGFDRMFCLDFTYLLSIPALIALCIGDVGMMLFSGAGVSGATFFHAVLACLGAAATGFGGIRLMRFLAEKNGFTGFAYYNWGMAMFAFLIYLIG